MFTSQIPINEQVKQIERIAFEYPNSRAIAIAIEANQAYIEHLDWLKDNLPPEDYSVTIEVNETRIKFKDDDSFENWLVEQLG